MTAPAEGCGRPGHRRSGPSRRRRPAGPRHRPAARRPRAWPGPPRESRTPVRPWQVQPGCCRSARRACCRAGHPRRSPATTALTSLLAVADSGLNCGSVPTGAPSRSRAGPGQTPTLLPAGTAASGAAMGRLLPGPCGVSAVADTSPPPAATRTTAARTPPSRRARGSSASARPRWRPGCRRRRRCPRQWRGPGRVCGPCWPGVGRGVSSLGMLMFLTQGAFVPGEAGVRPAGRHGDGQQGGQANDDGLGDAGPERPRVLRSGG